MRIEGGEDNMELELMNIFHLYFGDKITIIRANMTKKQLADELKTFGANEPVFKPVKFRDQMIKKGYKFYYEQM
jgi:hypothetical protein